MNMDELVGQATDLVDADERMLYALVKARRDAGLSQEYMATLLGWSIEDVRNFERYDYDPTLSEIRRYKLVLLDVG